MSEGQKSKHPKVRTIANRRGKINFEQYGRMSEDTNPNNLVL